MNIEDYRAMKAAEAAQAESEEKNKPVEQPKAASPQETPQDQTTPPDEQGESTPKEEKVAIDGIGEITLEELKKGYLRQSDYTKKTQELSRKNKQTEEAMAFLDYFRQHPQEAQKVFPDGQLPATLDPQHLKMQELENKVYDMMLEREIETLQKKYPDFEIREVLAVAHEKKITDLEDAYHIVQSRQPAQAVDKEALKKELRQELLKELAAEKEATSTVISSSDNQPVAQHNDPQLSDNEKKVALGLKMTESEYIKWRDLGRKK